MSKLWWKKFSIPENLQEHMELSHSQVTSLSGFEKSNVAMSTRVEEEESTVLSLPDPERAPRNDEILLQSEEEDDLITCGSCEFSSKSESQLLNHMKIHMKRKKAQNATTTIAKKTKVSPTCELCGKEFSRKDSLNRHKNNVHKLINWRNNILSIIQWIMFWMFLSLNEFIAA